MEFSITTETCRICLDNKPECKLLSDPYAGEIPPSAAKLNLECYMDVYKYVAEFPNAPASKLITPPSTALFFPKRICKACITQLHIAFVFHRKVLKSENVLKNLLDLYGYKDHEETVIEEEEIEIEHEDTIDFNGEAQEYEYVDEETEQYVVEETEQYSEENEYEEVVESSTVVSSDRQLEDSNSNANSQINRRSRSKSPLFKGGPLMSQCQYCGKMMQTRSLKKHRESHEGGRKYRFPCDICGRHFTLKENLNKHKRIHFNDKRYKCPYCDEKFLHKATCKYHVLSRHTGEKPYVCDICGKDFRHISQKYLHVRQHTGATPYACEICNRKFVSLPNKKRHLLSHSDAKNFHCNLCGKSYKSPMSLRVHTRTLHNQERNYVCSICNRAFSHNNGLKSHLMKNHPEYEPPPPGTVVSIRAIERMRQKTTTVDFSGI